MVMVSSSIPPSEHTLPCQCLLLAAQRPAILTWRESVPRSIPALGTMMRCMGLQSPQT